VLDQAREPPRRDEEERPDEQRHERQVPLQDEQGANEEHDPQCGGEPVDQPGQHEALDRLDAELLVEALPAKPEPYLAVEEAAEYLAAPKSRIYELVERGRLNPYRDGRRLLFRREDLDAVLHREEAP
jgi:excisionase family DNA binding protein